MWTGAEAEIERCAGLAKYFRDKIVEHDLPSGDYQRVIEQCRYPSASHYTKCLRDLSEDQGLIRHVDLPQRRQHEGFRVGHIGYLKKEDYDKLIAAFEELRERRVI